MDVWEFIEDESGANAIEYGLLAAIIGLGVIGGSFVMGTQLQQLFEDLSSSLATSTSSN